MFFIISLEEVNYVALNSVFSEAQFPGNLKKYLTTLGWMDILIVRPNTPNNSNQENFSFLKTIQ